MGWQQVPVGGGRESQGGRTVQAGTGEHEQFQEN